MSPDFSMSAMMCAETDECMPEMARLKSRFHADSGSSSCFWKQIFWWMNFHTREPSYCVLPSPSAVTS